MSTQVTLSILGLYKYDNTLFDGMVVPSSLDKNLIIDNILMELAELEVIYPDPDFMKFAIARWSAKQKFAWEDYMKVLEVPSGTKLRVLIGAVLHNPGETCDLSFQLVPTGAK